MLTYSHPTKILLEASSYEEMMTFPGIATFTDENIRDEILAAGDTPYDRANHVRRNAKRFFPGMHGGDMEFFGSSGSGYEEYGKWHVDPYGVAASLCLMGSAKMEFTQLDLTNYPGFENLLKTNPGLFEVELRRELNRGITRFPPSESHILPIVNKPGTYIKFNGGVKAGPEIVHPHRVSSLELPRVSGTGISLLPGPVLQTL